MSQTLNLGNVSSNNIITQSTLNGDFAGYITTLVIQNNADFVAGWIQVGYPGSQFSEIVQITGASGAGNLPINGTTKLPHNNGDPVYMLFGNQINVYSAADVYGNGTQPPDTNFTKLSGMPITIDGSRQNTSYTDTNGVAGTWYKYTYYNSLSTAETSLADSNAVQSGQIHYVSLDQVKRAAGLRNSPNVTNDVVAEFRDAAEREINGALLPVYQFPLPQPANPLIVQIAKNIAAGELRYEMFQNSAPQIAADAMGKADAARHGGGSHTSLDELVTRDVVLEDANFTELTIEEGHGFGGWPDATTQFVSQNQEDSNGNLIDLGGDDGHQFQITQDY